MESGLVVGGFEGVVVGKEYWQSGIGRCRTIVCGMDRQQSPTV